MNLFYGSKFHDRIYSIAELLENTLFYESSMKISIGCYRIYSKASSVSTLLDFFEEHYDWCDSRHCHETNCITMITFML